MKCLLFAVILNVTFSCLLYGYVEYYVMRNNLIFSFSFFYRYINHSCAPNCVAEVVTFERGYKIIISCIRRVEKGEEVSEDYFFYSDAIV